MDLFDLRHAIEQAETIELTASSAAPDSCPSLGLRKAEEFERLIAAAVEQLT